jgi:hypothetical protein
VAREITGESSNAPTSLCFSELLVARSEGFEPPTPRFVSGALPVQSIIPCSRGRKLSNNIIQKGLAFGRDWSGSVVDIERMRSEILPRRL